MNLAKLHNGRHYNAHPTTLNGKQATEFYGGFVNYLTPANNWADIDCIIKESGSVFEVTKAPFECTFPLYADGEAFFNNNNRFDVLTKTLIDCGPLGMRVRPLGVSHVQGQLFDINGDGHMDGVLYPLAYADNADLIHYTRDRMLRIDRRMNDAIMYEINSTFNKAVREAKRSRLTNWNRSPVLRLFGYNKAK